MRQYQPRPTGFPSRCCRPWPNCFPSLPPAIACNAAVFPDMVQAVPYWVDDESGEEPCLWLSREGCRAAGLPGCQGQPHVPMSTWRSTQMHDVLRAVLASA